MPLPPRFRLSDAEKDALLAQQQDMIERLVARITELEALVGKPRNVCQFAYPAVERRHWARQKEAQAIWWAAPCSEGKARPLTETPDKTERRIADACGYCGTDVSSASQRCRHRYDHIDLLPIRPVVARVELFGGRCGGCGRRYRAEAPAGMQPGTLFGPGIRSLLVSSSDLLFDAMLAAFRQKLHLAACSDLPNHLFSVRSATILSRHLS
jgi:transposase